MHLILAINPGSTSTKIGLFKEEQPVFMQTIEHDPAILANFDSIPAQKEFRYKLVIKTLLDNGYKPSQLSAVVGRGGLLPTINSGGYIVNDKLTSWVSYELGGSHASNLGSLLAELVAKEAGCKAFIYDAVSAGRLPDIAKITGFAKIKRKSLSHVLNSRAQSIEYATKIGKSFEDLNVIIIHLGGGISLSVYEKGVLKDSVGDDWGPFSPERSGGAALMDFVDVFYESGMPKSDLKKHIRGAGGVFAHLNTTDIRKVEKMIAKGDEKAKNVLHAMCYNIAKAAGGLATTLNGNVDVIIITGGIARSGMVCKLISERLSFISHIEIMPGEYELEALAYGGLRMLKGTEIINEIAEIIDGVAVTQEIKLP